MEAAELDSRGVGKRGGGRGAQISPGIWSTISRASTSFVHRAQGAAGLRACRHSGGRAVGFADALGLRGRGRFPASENSLDVVAGHWRIDNRVGRIDLPASVGRGLR